MRLPCISYSVGTKLETKKELAAKRKYPILLFKFKIEVSMKQSSELEVQQLPFYIRIQEGSVITGP